MLSRDAAGKVVVWGGPPAGRACVSDPAARATNRRTPVLTTAKPAQEEPSRVSLRKHRISPVLKAPGKSGRSRNTRPSCRRPSPYHNLPGGWFLNASMDSAERGSLPRMVPVGTDDFFRES